MADPLAIASSGSLVEINNNQELVDVFIDFFLIITKRMQADLIGEHTLSLYNSRTCPYVDEIADTFAINIIGEPDIIKHALLQYPIFSKAMIGTQKGVTKVLEPVLSNIKFTTHDNDPDMPAYKFSVTTDNVAGIDQKKAISLVNRFACLRDADFGLVLVDVVCNKPFTIVTKMFVTQKREYNFNMESCHGN